VVISKKVMGSVAVDAFAFLQQGKQGRLLDKLAGQANAS